MDFCQFRHHFPDSQKFQVLNQDGIRKYVTFQTIIFIFTKLDCYHSISYSVAVSTASLGLLNNILSPFLVCSGNLFA